MCEAALDEAVVAVFRETPGVRDFVRAGETPTALSPSEVAAFLRGQAEAEVRVMLPQFGRGDRVRVLGGMFAGMEAEVAEVSSDGTSVRVRLTILGRPVTLELDPFCLTPASEPGPRP